MDIEAMETQYKAYIDEHIQNVKLVWEKVDPLLKGEYFLDDCDWHSINDLIREHDKSKYDSYEFEGYRKMFYPADGEPKDMDRFNNAWNHHQKNNPHHWEYWCLVENKGNIKTLDMPFPYIFEMLADWTAMSMKFNDTPSGFYKLKGTSMVLSGPTRKIVENWLPLFDKVVKGE